MPTATFVFFIDIAIFTDKNVGTGFVFGFYRGSSAWPKIRFGDGLSRGLECFIAAKFIPISGDQMVGFNAFVGPFFIGSRANDDIAIVNAYRWIVDRAWVAYVWSSIDSGWPVIATAVVGSGAYPSTVRTVSPVARAVVSSMPAPAAAAAPTDVIRRVVIMVVVA